MVYHGTYRSLHQLAPYKAYARFTGLSCVQYELQYRQRWGFSYHHGNECLSTLRIAVLWLICKLQSAVAGIVGDHCRQNARVWWRSFVVPTAVYILVHNNTAAATWQLIRMITVSGAIFQPMMSRCTNQRPNNNYEHNSASSNGHLAETASHKPRVMHTE